MSEAILIDHLRKRYVRSDVLVDVSFTVPTGSIYALLGKNGAGKTTTLNCLLGLTPADGGRLLVDGLPVRWNTFERLAYVPETSALYELLTVNDHLLMFAKQIKRFDPAYAAQLVRLFELNNHARIGTLSKGHKTALAVLLAFASRPDVIVLDEPTAGLDPAAQRRVLDLIVTAAAGGATILLSSHNVSQLERIADHVAILHNGRIALEGGLEELFAIHHIIEVAISTDDLLLELQTTGPIERVGSLARIHLNGDVSRAESLLANGGAQIVSVNDCTLEDLYFAQIGSLAQTRLG
jgi:ABC-2 type transport system ATP-binding protein